MANQSTPVLKMLMELASKEVDTAAEALAAALRAAEDANKKLDMLRDYRRGYEDNLSNLMQSGITAESYLNFQNFFKKLDQALDGQMEAVRYAQGNCEVQRQRWQDSQRKKMSFDVLLQRADKRGLQLEAKRDQKLMDEHAMRVSRPARK